MRLKNLKYILALLGLISTFNIAQSQEMLGLTMGNYKGITGVMINPASMTTNKVYLDINLATANVFLRNNFAYLPKEDFVIWDLLDKNYQFPTYGEEEKNVLYYNNSKAKQITQNTRILGPSAMIQIGDHAFGITTGVRVFTSGNNIPWNVAEFGYWGLDYGPLHNIDFDEKNIDFGSNSWMEVGLSYAYDVWKYYDQQLTVGLSVKKLWGYAGAYVYSDKLNYLVPNDTTIDIKEMNASLGFSGPINYDNSEFLNTSPTFRGSGVGMDIGVVYVKRRQVELNKWNGERLCAQNIVDYDYKIGVSIVDIGRVKFKENAQEHQFDEESIYWEDVDTLQFNNANSFLHELSNTFYGNPNASYVGDNIKIGLPTALSIQADFNLRNNIYVAGFFIHPLRLNKSTLRRTPQLAIIPRYETKYFELSVPISLYDYNYPRVGIAARFYFITIGTERLGTYLGLSDMNGMDIYASIKIGINKGSCKERFGGACDNNNFGNNILRRKR